MKDMDCNVLGSIEIGKKVPLKRNIGVINRKVK